MIRIIPNLYQGNLDDAVRVSKTKEVDAIVWLSQEIPRELSHDSMIPVAHIPMVDGLNEKKRIDLAFMVISYLRCESKTLVACRSGISRSPSIIIGYLSVYKLHKNGFEGSYRRIRRIIPSFQPEPHLLESIKQTVKTYFDEDKKEVIE